MSSSIDGSVESRRDAWREELLYHRRIDPRQLRVALLSAEDERRDGEVRPSIP
jgi:hypothetical protein